jgi:hypothetical protein
MTVLVLLTGSALAQDSDTPRKLTQESVETAAGESSQDAAANLQTTAESQALRTAMNDEIASRLAVEQETVAELVARLEAAASDQDRLALQKRIMAAKQTGWRDVLAIQLKYAELGGHTEQAEQLRERVARLDEGLSPAQTAPVAVPRSERGRDGAE